MWLHCHATTGAEGSSQLVRLVSVVSASNAFAIVRKRKCKANHKDRITTKTEAESGEMKRDKTKSFMRTFLDFTSKRPQLLLFLFRALIGFGVIWLGMFIG